MQAVPHEDQIRAQNGKRPRSRCQEGLIVQDHRPSPQDIHALRSAAQAVGKAAVQDGGEGALEQKGTNETRVKPADSQAAAGRAGTGSCRADPATQHDQAHEGAETRGEVQGKAEDSRGARKTAPGILLEIEEGAEGGEDGGADAQEAQGGEQEQEQR